MQETFPLKRREVQAAPRQFSFALERQICASRIVMKTQATLNLSQHSAECVCVAQLELELELIQTQMAQKPMLRAEVYAHAMRASQNRKKEVRREKEV